MGLGHRAEDPPPAPAAVTHQHLKPEHPLEQPSPGPASRDARLRVRPAASDGGRRHDGRLASGIAARAAHGRRATVGAAAARGRPSAPAAPADRGAAPWSRRSRAAKLIQELPARALRQSLQRQGRAQDVAAQLLQLIPPTRRHRHIRVQAEALEPSRAPPGRRSRRPPSGAGAPAARRGARAPPGPAATPPPRSRTAAPAPQTDRSRRPSSGHRPRRIKSRRTRRCTRASSTAMSASVGRRQAVEHGPRRSGSRACRRRRRAARENEH